MERVKVEFTEETKIPKPQTGKLTYELGDTRLSVEVSALESGRVHDALLAALQALTRPTFVVTWPDSETVEDQRSRLFGRSK